MQRRLVLLLLWGLAASASASRRWLFQSGNSSVGAQDYPSPALADYFVQIIDGEFALGCNKFPISGFNAWEVLEAGSGASAFSGSILKQGASATEVLLSVLDIAARNGFTVMRAWAHGVTDAYATVTSSGDAIDGVLKGLDFALAEARKRGLKVILSFASNWTPAGGVDFYAKSAGVSHNDFFTSDAAKSLYKKYVKAIIQRKNSITGFTYSEDPTIMAWNLLNEPVCRNCPQGAVTNWIKEMAGYVKSLDSNHLLSVGEEGFYSTTQSTVPVNPMYGEDGWAAQSGQDFVVDHSDSNIDYASFHGWPDLWSCQKGCDSLPLSFFQTWIDQHVKDTQSLGKPVLFEEFGKADGRDPFYQAAYDAVENSLKSEGPLKGALFWMMLGDGQDECGGNVKDGGLFGVTEGDSAFTIARNSAQASKDLYSGPAATCSKKADASAAVSAAGECAQQRKAAREVQEELGRSISRAQLREDRAQALETEAHELQIQLEAKAVAVAQLEERISQLEAQAEALQQQKAELRREKEQALLDAKRALSSSSASAKAVHDAVRAKEMAESDRDEAHRRMAEAQEAQFQAEKTATEAILERDRCLATKAAVDAKAAENGTLWAEADAAHAARRGAEEALAAAQKAAAAAIAERDAANTKAEAAHTALEAARKEAADLAQELERAKSELGSTQQELKSSADGHSQAMDKVRDDLANAVAEAASLRTSLASTEEAKANAESALQQTRQRVTSMIAKLEEAIAGDEATRKELESQKARAEQAERERDALKEQLQDVQDSLAEKAGLDEQLSEAQAVAAELQEVKAKLQDAEKVAVAWDAQKKDLETALEEAKVKLEEEMSMGHAAAAELSCLKAKLSETEAAVATQEGLQKQLEMVQGTVAAQEDLIRHLEEAQASLVASESIQAELDEALTARAQLEAKLQEGSKARDALAEELAAVQRQCQAALAEKEGAQVEAEILKDRLRELEKAAAAAAAAAAATAAQSDSEEEAADVGADKGESGDHALKADPGVVQENERLCAEVNELKDKAVKLQEINRKLLARLKQVQQEGAGAVSARKK